MMARSGHQLAPVARASVPSAGSGAAGPAELPLAAAPEPVLCRMVLVTTIGAIRGRTEHAAMITAVNTDDTIDVTLFPAGEPPYPVQGIRRADPASANAITWRWPPRV